MQSHTPAGWKSAWSVSAIVALVIVAGYVLSPVPARVLVHWAGRRSEDGLHSVKVGLETFYQPIGWAAARNSWVGSFYEAQMKFCQERGWLPDLGYSTDVPTSVRSREAQ